MMAFGRDGILDRAQVTDVVAYVQSLGGAAHPAEADPGSVERGGETFAANCAACHGDDGKGSYDLGAPDLTDAGWIYGGDRQSITTTVYAGHQGQMPSWEDRLTAVQRKILTLYVLSLGGSTQ